MNDPAMMAGMRTDSDTRLPHGWPPRLRRTPSVWAAACAERHRPLARIV